MMVTATINASPHKKKCAFKPKSRLNKRGSMGQNEAVKTVGTYYTTSTKEALTAENKPLKEACFLLTSGMATTMMVTAMINASTTCWVISSPSCFAQIMTISATNVSTAKATPT